MKSLKKRAEEFAEAKVKLGTHSNSDAGPLAEGFIAGYKARKLEQIAEMYKAPESGRFSAKTINKSNTPKAKSNE